MLLFTDTKSFSLEKWLLTGLFFLICCDSPGQFAYLPDSIRLNDARFFTSKAWRDTLEQDPITDINSVAKAIGYARSVHDIPLEAYADLKMAKILLSKKQYSEAFDWLKRSLMLDSLYAPLHPVKQYIYKEVGSFYSDFGTYAIAIQYVRRAMDISIKRDRRPTERLYSLYSNYAILHYKCGLRDSSLFYYKKAIEVAKGLNYFWEASALNNYGIMLNILGKTDSAEIVLNRAISVLKVLETRDAEFLTSIKDNLAEVYAVKKDFKKALVLFDFKFNYGLEHYKEKPGYWTKIIESGIRGAGMLVKIGDINTAKKRIAFINSFFETQPLMQKYQHKLGLNKVKQELAAKMGDKDELIRLQKILLEFKDDQIADVEQDRLGKLEDILLESTDRFNKEIEIEKLKLRESRARARFNKTLAAGAAFTGILIITIILILYRRKVTTESYKRELAESNLKNEQLSKNQLKQQLELNRVVIEQESYKRELAEINLKNEQLEKQHFSQQLELKKRDVTDYALAYSQRKKILDQVLNKLKDIKKSSDPVQQLQELGKVLKGQLQTDTIMEIEPGRIAQVNHEFFEKLATLCPDLTPGEKDLTGLIRLNFSSKEISSLRNISPASVRISKFRLKRKLRLAPEEDLVEFIKRV